MKPQGKSYSTSSGGTQESTFSTQRSNLLNLSAKHIWVARWCHMLKCSQLDMYLDLDLEFLLLTALEDYLPSVTTRPGRSWGVRVVVLQQKLKVLCHSSWCQRSLRVLESICFNWINVILFSTSALTVLKQLELFILSRIHLHTCRI